MPKTYTFNIPGAPVELLAQINARATRIPNGMSMMADQQQDVSSKQGSGDNPEADDAKAGDEQREDGFKSEHSKQALLSDLAKERDERKALQKQVEELGPIKAQMEQLAAVFGKPADDKVDPMEIIAEMQRRLDEADAAAAHAALVADVTKNYDSLSASDVALVGQLSEREAMEALAKRLSEGVKPDIPRSDRSVGRGGSGKAEGGSVSAGRDLYRDRHTKNRNS